MIEVDTMMGDLDKEVDENGCDISRVEFQNNARWQHNDHRSTNLENVTNVSRELQIMVKKESDEGLRRHMKMIGPSG